MVEAIRFRDFLHHSVAFSRHSQSQRSKLILSKQPLILRTLYEVNALTYLRLCTRKTEFCVRRNVRACLIYYAWHKGTAANQTVGMLAYNVELL